MCAAPFRNTSSIKTTSNSKWSEGIYPTTEGNNVAQYGVITVTDTGDELTVEFEGYDTSDTVRVSMTVDVPVEGPAPTVTTAGLTGPTGRWQGKATRLSWWDGTRWGAVLPTDQGHVIYPDLADLEVAGPVVDDRQSSRATVVFHDGTLMVLRGHASASRFSSYDATDGYSVIVDDASVPLTSSNLDASPVTLHRSPNGYLWAACMTGGAVQVTRSTNNGATWGTAQTVATISNVSGVVGLASTGSTVVLLATANDGQGRAARSISQSSGSYASGSWTTETLPALPAGVTSDDHLDIGTLPDGRVLAVSKATNSSNTWLLYSMLRASNGTWSQAAVTTGQDSEVGDTRPSLAVEPGAARVLYGRLQSTPPANLLTRVGTHDAWSSQVTLLAGGDRSDSGVPPAAEHIAAASGDYPVLVHDRSSDDVDVVWVTPTEALQLSGSASVGTATSAAVSVDTPDVLPLAGSATVVTGTTGAIGVDGPDTLNLTGSATAASATSGVLSLDPADALTLTGGATVVTTTTGALGVDTPDTLPLAGSASVVTTTTGAVGVDTPDELSLSGAATVVTGTTGALQVVEPGALTLTGAAEVRTTTSGTVTVDGPDTHALTGAATVVTATTGALQVEPAGALTLTGSATATTGTSGQLGITHPDTHNLTGAAAVVVTATSGALTVQAPGDLTLSGGVTVRTRAAGVLRAVLTLAGYVTAVTAATARLRSSADQRNITLRVLSGPSFDSMTVTGPLMEDEP